MAATVLAYLYWSTRSNGFYQHDEAAHFLAMRSFWNDPASILGNWAKFGYRILYILPATLGGAPLVLLVNCLFAAGAGLFIGLALQAQRSTYALAGFLLTVLQPLYLNLSFRNYSEVPTAFLLALAYYLHVKKQPLFAMLALSFICTIRQEFYLILGMYGLALLFKRQWVAAFAGALFPLIQNFYGAYYTGNDYLYLLHQLTGQTQTLGQLWPRQGGDHYLLTSMVIFGPIAIALAVHYMVWSTWQRLQPDWYLIAPVLVYYLFQSIINVKDPEIGPATGGNLRYMLVISPLVGAMGALGLQQFAASVKKSKAAIIWVVLILITFVFLNHKSDLLHLTEDTDATPALGVIMAAALLFWPGKAAVKTPVLAVCLGLLVLLTVKPLKRTQEENICKQVASWYKANEATYKGHRIYVDHAMFYYFLGRTRYEFTPLPFTATLPENITKAQVGDLVLWDSHYAARPNRVTQEYYLNDPEHWALVQQNITDDQRFGILIFQKIKQ